MNTVYTKEMNQARIQMKLDVINAMVKEGFTFFSGIHMDSNVCKRRPDDQRFREEGDYDSVNRLFFHIPGKACLVIVNINQWAHQSKESKEIDHHLYVNCDLIMEHRDFYSRGYVAYKEIFDLAKTKGYMVRRFLSEVDYDEEDIVCLPWWSCGNTEKMRLGNWSYHGGHFGNNICNIHLESSTNRFENIDTETRIHDLAENIRDAVPFLKEGKISEIQPWELVGHRFDEADDYFFARFNSAYYRHNIA